MLYIILYTCIYNIVPVRCIDAHMYNVPVCVCVRQLPCYSQGPTEQQDINIVCDDGTVYNIIVFCFTYFPLPLCFLARDALFVVQVTERLTYNTHRHSLHKTLNNIQWLCTHQQYMYMCIYMYIVYVQ